MGTNKWLEVRFKIEILLFFDVIIGAVLLNVAILIVTYQAPMRDFVLLSIGLLVVVGFINCIGILYILTVSLPRAVRARLQFTREEIAWGGSTTIAEELHLLDPGHERVGMFPSWKCTVGVAAGLLADLVLAEIVEIIPVNPIPDSVIARISSSPSFLNRDIDPIASIMLDRFFTRSNETDRTIRNWMLMCEKVKISLNDGLLQRLVYKGYLNEISIGNACILKTPQFISTPEGKTRCKMGLLLDFLHDVKIKPLSSRDLFFLYLASFGRVGITKKQKKERVIAREHALRIKEELPSQLKIIAEVIEVLNWEDRSITIGF
ncbi:MAG: hypothetical protein Q6373_007040 [Candidatus Sigynarchaeota archaeon]